MIVTTVTANATTTVGNISAATPVTCTDPQYGVTYQATITHSASTTSMPVNSFVVVAGVTPSTYNGTFQVIATGPGTVTLNYGTTNPGTWTSGGTVTTSAASPMVPLDFNNVPFAVGLGCVITGTVTYTAQHTFDDIFDPRVNPTWIDQPVTGISGKSANADGNYAFPVKATRVNTTAGSGSVAMTVIQGRAVA